MGVGGEGDGRRGERGIAPEQGGGPFRLAHIVRVIIYCCHGPCNDEVPRRDCSWYSRNTNILNYETVRAKLLP
mgnify:CR=1 FL=1